MHAAVPGALPFWQSRITDGLEVVEVPEGQVPAAVLAYRQQPGVLSASPSYEITALEIPNDTEFDKLWGLHNVAQSVNGTTGLFDADTDATLAWDIWQGSADCLIAVVDTGVDYSHPDLYLNIWINQAEIPPTIRAQLTDVDLDGVITFQDLNQSVNQGPGKITDLNGNGYIDGGDVLRTTSQGGWANGVDDDVPLNGYIDDLHGWDAFGSDRFPNPTGAATPNVDPSHGTEVAGVAAAVGNNNQGVIGIARGCKIVAIKFGNENGTLFTANALPAMDYLIANAVRYNIRVSIHSWGLLPWKNNCLEVFPQNLYLKFAELHATGGHLAVAAAGNYEFDCWSDYDNDETPVFPASFGVTRDYTFNGLHVDGLASVISVAGTTSDDTLAGCNTSALCNAGGC